MTKSELKQLIMEVLREETSNEQPISTEPEKVNTSSNLIMSPTPPKLGDVKEISEDDWEKARALLDAHNNSATNDFAEFYLDVTGKHQVYFTFWRHKLFDKDFIPSEYVKNPTYMQNLTTNFLTSVQKALSKPVVHGSKVHVVDDETRVGLIGKTKTEKPEEIIFTFGKYRGKTYGEVYLEDPGYFLWLVKNVDPKYAKGPKFEAQVQYEKMYWEDMTKKNKETSTSLHIGQQKDVFTGKLRVYAEPKLAQSGFGAEFYTVYKMIDDKGNKFMSTGLEKYFPDIKKDDLIDIKGKIKGHKEIVGINFTLLNYVRPAKTTPKGT